MTVELAHDSRGTGPLLVLVHGITEDRRSWDPLTNELAHDHRLLRVDLRGHGESPGGDTYGMADYAADIHAVVGDDEPPLLVGHSLGGFVATAYAAAFETRGVINVDQPVALAGFREAVVGLEPELRSDRFGATIDALFESMRGTLDDEQWARLSALRSPRQDVVLGTWGLLLDNDAAALDATVRATTGAVRVPYLALLGNDLGPDYAAYLADVLPQARLETWQGAGHYPHLVDPERFAALVRDFEAQL